MQSPSAMVASDLTSPCRNAIQKRGIDVQLTAYEPLWEPVGSSTFCTPVAEGLKIGTFWYIFRRIYAAHELWTSVSTPYACLTVDGGVILFRMVHDCAEVQI